MVHGIEENKEINKLIEANDKVTTKARQAELAKDSNPIIRYTLAGSTDSAEVQKVLASDNNVLVLNALAWNTKIPEIQDILALKGIPALAEVIGRRKTLRSKN